MLYKLLSILFAILVIIFGTFALSADATTQEPPTIKEVAQDGVEYYFGEGQWKYFNKIVVKESNWKHTAQNPTSSAYGLCQFLSSTYRAYGEKTDNPYKQLEMCFEYIKDRYDTPKQAWNHHLQNNWY